MNYASQLAGWALLQAGWQTLALALLLPASMKLVGGGSSERRYRIAALHLAATLGAVALTLAASHASVAVAVAGAGQGSAWLPSPSEEALPVLSVLAWIWVGGMGAVHAMLLLRLLRLAHLLCRAVPAPAGITAVVEELSRRAGLSRAPLVFAADVRSPLVAGWRCSMVVVPRLFGEMHPPAEVRALLAHELAHVIRRDYSRNIFQLLGVSVLWWHPGVWFIYRTIRHERECRVDELAVRMAGSAAGLANGLFRLADLPAAADAVLVGADSSGIVDRIARLADPPVRQTSRLTSLLCAVSVVMFAAMVILESVAASRVGPLTQAWAASPLSPRTVFTIRAHDPAGTFLVRMLRGRVLDVVLGQEPVPPGRVVQRGGTVRVVSQGGRELLRLEVDPRGGFRWTPRHAS